VQSIVSWGCVRLDNERTRAEPYPNQGGGYVKRILQLALVALWVLGIVVAATPNASARFRASDPDDVRYHLDIRSARARASHGWLRVHFGFYERIRWEDTFPVAVVHLNTRRGPRFFDYDLSTSRRGPRRFRCELRTDDTGRTIDTWRSFAHGRRWLSCGVPLRSLLRDHRIKWHAIAYLIGTRGTDNAPDDGVYPHA
jgi:hypothetical protein